MRSFWTQVTNIIISKSFCQYWNLFARLCVCAAEQQLLRHHSGSFMTGKEHIIKMQRVKFILCYGHQHVHHASLLMLTRSAKSLLVQEPKWLPDASSILLWLKLRHIHAHTHFYFLQLYFSLAHSRCCFSYETYQNVSSYGLLAHLFTSGVPSQCNAHTQTKTWGLFMKVQHPQLLLWKVISHYCSNTVIRGPEAERSQQLLVPVVLLPPSSSCTLEDWAELPQVPVQAALGFSGQQHTWGDFRH